MARPPTRFSRASIGMISSAESVIDRDAGDSGEIFSVLGDYTLTGDGTFTGDLAPTGDITLVGDLTQTGDLLTTGTLTHTGAATFSSTVSVATSLAVGYGTAVTSISLVTATINFGSIDDHGGTSTLTVGISGSTYEDLYVVTTPSIWSGLDDQLSVTARSGDTTGEVDIVAVNSGFTARDATAGTFVVMRVGF